MLTHYGWGHHSGERPRRLVLLMTRSVDASGNLAPVGAPAAADMQVATPRPTLTPGKAALVAMVDRYSALALGASLIEIQKLMYLLQEAGEPLVEHIEVAWRHLRNDGRLTPGPPTPIESAA